MLVWLVLVLTIGAAAVVVAWLWSELNKERARRGLPPR